MRISIRRGSRIRQHRPRLQANRAGVQLLELSMVIAVMGMICVAGTRVIFALMAIENRSGETLHNADVLDRLGRQWRSDVHEATQADLTADGRTMSFTMEDGRRVTYQIESSRLTREEPIAHRRMPATETFAATSRQWRFEKDDKAGLIAVIRESTPSLLVGVGSDASPSRVDRIEAAIGTLTTPSKAPASGASP